MKPLIRFVVLSLALAIAWGQSNKTGKTDEEIRRAIIQESIARYRGSSFDVFTRKLRLHLFVQLFRRSLTH